MHRFFIKRTLITSQILKKTGEELANTTKKCTEQYTPKKQSKYTNTILLPQTKFPAQLNGKARIDTDKHLTEVSRYIFFFIYSLVYYSFIYLDICFFDSIITEVWLF